MDVTYLSVGLVEDLQRTLILGRPIAPVVAGLRRASLPGMLEYGCLRHTIGHSRMPGLPEAITSSTLGTALDQVPSILGIRSDGPARRPSRRTESLPAEFHAIVDADEIQDSPWEEFLLRFEFSAKEAGFSPRIAAGLQGALHEIAANAATHSRSSVSALAGYEVRDGIALFSVVDVGIGVLASLRTNPTYRHFHLHSEAIQAALRDGVSSVVGPQQRGFGFRQVFKSLAEQWGNLRFRSGEGCVEMDGTGLVADQGKVSFPPPLPGFQVTVCCRTSSPVSR